MLNRRLTTNMFSSLMIIAVNLKVIYRREHVTYSRQQKKFTFCLCTVTVVQRQNVNFILV